MMTDKWDALLTDESLDNPDTERRRRLLDRSGRLPVAWGRILIVLLTLCLVATTIIWLWGHPTRHTYDTNKPDTPVATSPGSSLTDVTASPTWSYKSEVVPVPEVADRAVATADEFLHLIYQPDVDWWQIDDQLADVATDQVRYELIEYPHLHEELDEAIDIIEYTEISQPSVGTWSSTAHITAGSIHVTGRVTVQATEEGWRITSWETAP